MNVEGYPARWVSPDGQPEHRHETEGIMNEPLFVMACEVLGRVVRWGAWARRVVTR